VRADGVLAGVAGGSLDLSKFERFVDDFRTLHETKVTVVDQHSRLIYTNGQASFTALQNLADEPLVVASATAENGLFRYQLPASNRGAQLAALSVIEPLGWKVFIEQPLLKTL